MGKKITTLPLEPLFDNPQFQDLSPASKFYLIQAIYMLSQKGRLRDRPVHLRQYFLCCTPLYYRMKGMYECILDDVIPKMIKIKNLQITHVDNAVNKNRSNAVIRRKKRNENVDFSDGQGLHVEIIPVNSPRKNWNEGKFDHVERAAAVTANDESKEKDTWLKDT